MDDINFGGAGGDEDPFMGEIADKISFVASLVGDLAVSSLLKKTHSSSFDLNVSKNHVKRCN